MATKPEIDSSLGAEHSHFQGFSIRKLLGVGATAEVFAATNSKSGKDVALKVFSPLVSRDKDVISRLKEEASVLARLRHPNVVSTYGIQMSQDGDAQARFAIELELVDGVDLRTWINDCAEKSPLIEHKIWTMAQIARGLGAAHEIGALHRDLKPENVLVSESGDVKLTDFGLARTVTRMTMTRIGLLVGSLGYLAPEVINGERASVQSDIFSLGVIAYEILTGQPPFVGETPQALIYKLTQGSHTPLQELAPYVPHDICKIIDACLSKHPSERPASVWEVEACLMTTLANGPILRFAKKILASTLSVSGALSDEELSEIFSLKREWLYTNASKIGRQAALAEFHRLFPNDPDITKIISATELPTVGQPYGRGKVFSLTAAIASVAMITILAFSKMTCSEQAPVTKQASMNSPSVPPETKIGPKPELVAPPAVKNLVRENRPSPKGTLKFEVPDDVQVYVANELVPKNLLSNFKIAPGQYPMRMVKDGFLPIEGVVDVKAGRVAVIRAGGQP